jgi:hypothetical protein
VEMEEGAFDITPTGASQSYPFVRHTGTDEEFELMAAAVRVVVPANGRIRRSPSAALGKLGRITPAFPVGRFRR